jgi:hypothetical protein
MARPKRLKSPVRLDLLIENKSKRDAFVMATKRAMSVSRLFEHLIAAEKKRGDGEVRVPPSMPGIELPASS